MSNNVLKVFQCPISKECKNDLCFFRKRDIFGMNVWASAYWNMTEEGKIMYNKLWKDVLWPRLKIKPSTNGYNIICLDEKLE